MRFGILGKLEVSRDGEPVAVGAYRQKCLLAYLLIHHNKIVSTDQIIDALWGIDSGGDRRNALWVYVSGLRKALEPDRPKRADGSVLLTREPGYLLNIDPTSIDVVNFERLVGESRSLSDIDPAAASLALSEALAMWRGRAYEDFAYEEFAESEIARLDELRLEAVEARIGTDLKRGMSLELLSELEGLVRQHPLREGFAGQAMLAFYRSGRQAEALRSYQAVKTRLGAELGIEPSDQLRQLEEQIVTADPSLQPERMISSTIFGPQPGLAVRGYEVRDKVEEVGLGVVYDGYQPSTGREVSIKVIRPELANESEFIRRFEAEAQLIARLEHPNIVPLYDFWREPGAAYLVMRRVGRQTLRDVTPLDRAGIIALVSQLSGALATAHQQGVSHGDLRPENIKADSAGNFYLAGFALSSVGDDVDPAARREDQRALASVVEYAIQPGHDRPIPQPLALVLERAGGYQSMVDFASEVATVLGGEDGLVAPIAAAVATHNPYVGLRAFERTDAPYFFGRGRVIDRLVGRLGAQGLRSRFIAVVGPSGSGKSSVVKAGLLPALSGGAIPNSEEWFATEMVPAPDPFEALETALSRVATNPDPTLLEKLASGVSGFANAVSEVLPVGQQLLLVIDQFEELFTQVDPELADRFLDGLVAIVTNRQVPIRVVVTMRADHYDRPLERRGLGELLRDGTEVITPMSADEIDSAITGPARLVGVLLEPALVTRMVRDADERGGALPLLEYTLTELFNERASATITLDQYVRLGGVSGALLKRADGIYSRLSRSARDAARQVFLRLVTLGEKGEDSRRRASLRELGELPIPKRDLDSVLESFGRARLLSFDRDSLSRGPTVEISHESILSQWTRLARWTREARHDMRNQRRLAAALDEWRSVGSEDTYLLHGGRLDQLAGWATETTLSLSASESRYLTMSLRRRDEANRIASEREDQAAAAEESAGRRLRMLAAVSVAALLIGVLAVFAVLQRRSAVEAETTISRSARSLELAAEANGALDNDPQLALLLAVESVQATIESGFVTPEAVDAMHWAIQANRVTYPTTDDTRIAVRSGPFGVVGVFALDAWELVDLAAGAVERSFTAQECEAFLPEDPCPEGVRPVPTDLEVFGGEEAYGASPDAPRALTGTSISLMAAWRLEAGLEDELQRFEDTTGINISYLEVDGINGVIERALDEGARLPELAIWPQPGGVVTQAENGLLIDLSAFFSSTDLDTAFGPHLASLLRRGPDGSWPAAAGSIHAVPVDIDVKGLVFYPRSHFEAAGYAVPETLSELVTLTEQIAADGRTPWCVAFEAGGTPDGWPGTDWVENVVLRVGGPSVYDAWASHRIPFDNPDALAAAAIIDRLISPSGHVRGGREFISRLSFIAHGIPPLLADEPECWLHQGPDFLLGFVPEETEFGSDLDVFVMPPVERGQVTPVTGGGNLLAATVDRPEIRAFLQHVVSPTWGELWAAAPTSEFISPHIEFDVNSYGAEASDSIRSVRSRLGRVAQEAVAANAYRFDASDLMPPVIGAATPDGRGAFWQGMLDFVDGTRTLPQVLADIEATWSAVELEG